MRHIWLAAFCLAFLVPVSPAQVHPAKLAAHDSHQGLTVSCDPYQDAQRAKKALGKDNPLKAGILPIDVHIQNTTRWPVAVTLNTIHIEVGIPGQGNQELDPLSPSDVATSILHPKPPHVREPRVPLPLPGLRHPGKKWQKLRDSLLEASLQSGVVAPGATVHGFLYFDFSFQYDLLQDARLIVPDLNYLGNTQAIMFFEVRFSPQSAN